MLLLLFLNGKRLLQFQVEETVFAAEIAGLAHELQLDHAGTIQVDVDVLDSLGGGDVIGLYVLVVQEDGQVQQSGTGAVHMTHFKAQGILAVDGEQGVRVAADGVAQELEADGLVLTGHG